MSLLDNLPNVLSAVAVASAFVNDAQQAPALFNIDPNLAKPFVICLTKSLSKDDLALLASYGTVLSYDHDILNNVPLSTLQFQYFICDIREDNDRMYFQKNILLNTSLYHLILYRYSFESDNGISFEVEQESLPPKQATALMFNTLLLQTPITRPSCVMSFFRKCLTAGHP